MISTASLASPASLRPRLLTVVALVGLLAAALLATSSSAHAQGTFVGPKQYYLALGDSLAYGYQPNFDWSHGYANYFFTNLQGHGSNSLINMGCPGETTTTFINGGCANAWLDHYHYSGAQLNAAVNFIKSHPGQVSPVTLDIGANDLTPDITISGSTCTIKSTWATDEQNTIARIKSILTALMNALTNSSGQLTGDLLVMNYYDPYENVCSASLPDLATFDSDIASAVSSVYANFGSNGNAVADVFGAFGGQTPPPNSTICNDTWYTASCPGKSSSTDIHPNRTGYSLIATTFETVYGF